MSATQIDLLRREFWEMLESQRVQKPSEWIEENVILTEGPRAGEPFRFAGGYAYLREVVDVLMGPQRPGEGKRSGVIKKPSQSGFTTLLLAASAYRAVHLRKPVLFVEPRDSDANRVAGEFARLTLASAALAEEFPSRDAKKLRWTRDGTKIFFRFSNSQSEGVGFSSQCNIYDENDRLYVGEDFSAKDMFAKRQTAWPDAIEISLSTPTTPGFGVDALYETSDQRERYVVCPHCGEAQAPTFDDNVSWDEKAGSRELQAASAWFHCSKCHERWSRHDRIQADDRGFWKATHPERRFYGWNIAAFAIATRNASDLVAAHLKGETSEQARREHHNQDRAEAYQPKGGRPTEAILEAVVDRDGLEWGRCPAGTRRLTCGIDMQRSAEPYDYVWQVHAYDSEGFCSVIAYGIASGDDAICEILQQDWGGRRIQRALLDGSDGAHHSARARQLAERVPVLDAAVFDHYASERRELVTTGKGGLKLVNREWSLNEAMGRFPSGVDLRCSIRVAKHPERTEERAWQSHYRLIHYKQTWTDEGPQYRWEKLNPMGCDYPFAAALAEVARKLEGDLLPGSGAGFKRLDKGEKKQRQLKGERRRLVDQPERRRGFGIIRKRRGR